MNVILKKIILQLFCGLLFFWFLFSALSFAQSSSELFPTNKYTPRLELTLKGGNARSIGRVGGVIPIAETNKGLLFTNIFGLLESQDAKEGNIGLGYRHLYVDSYILGVSMFYDYRASQYENKFNQITLGLEYLRENFEIRANAYLPVGKKEQLVIETKRQFIAHNALIAKDRKMSERILHGFDVEMGGNIPSFKALEVFIAYYHFNAPGVKEVHGIRFRSNLKLNEYISLEGEISSDRLRREQTGKDVILFGGIKLHYTFGKKKEPLSGVERKMTQMVVRDIDIIIQKRIKKNKIIDLSSNCESDENKEARYLRDLGLLQGKRPTEGALKKAYKSNALKEHPDKHNNSDEATAVFQELTDKHNWLRNYYGYNANNTNTDNSLSYNQRHDFNQEQIFSKEAERHERHRGSDNEQTDKENNVQAPQDNHHSSNTRADEKDYTNNGNSYKVTRILEAGLVAYQASNQGIQSRVVCGYSSVKLRIRANHTPIYAATKRTAFVWWILNIHEGNIHQDLDRGNGPMASNRQLMGQGMQGTTEEMGTIRFNPFGLDNYYHHSLSKRQLMSLLTPLPLLLPPPRIQDVLSPSAPLLPTLTPKPKFAAISTQFLVVEQKTREGFQGIAVRRNGKGIRVSLIPQGISIPWQEISMEMEEGDNSNGLLDISGIKEHLVPIAPYNVSGIPPDLTKEQLDDFIAWTKWEVKPLKDVVSKKIVAYKVMALEGRLRGGGKGDKAISATKPATSAFGTGGGGHTFEQRIQLHFLIKLLTKGHFPVIGDYKSIKWLKFQAQPKYETDDIAVCVVDRHDSERILLGQIKHRLTFTASNEDFAATLRQMWQDFLSKENDKMEFAIITGPLSKKEIDIMRPMFEAARATATLEDFFARGYQTMDKKKGDKESKYQVIANIVHGGTIGPVSHKTIWAFCKKLHLLSFDSDYMMQSTDYANDITHIKSGLAPSSPLTADAMYNKLYMLVSEWNQSGAELSRETIPDEIKTCFRSYTSSLPYLFNMPLSSENHVRTQHEKNVATRMALVDGSNPTKWFAIYGMGGIGKTYIANYLAHHPPFAYRARVWFNAETNENLMREHREFAAHKNITAREDSDGTALTKIKEWFCANPGWLIVYDNADTYTSLKKFIPAQGGFCLLTTRTAKGQNGYKVTHMESDASVELIKKYILAFSDKSVEQMSQYEADIGKLVNVLGHLPLAMAQAGAHIGAAEIEPQDYLAKYESTKQTMLEDTTLQDEYGEHVPIYVTWDITFQKLRSQHPTALQLLNVLVYFSASNIPRRIVERASSEFKQDDLVVLKRYSVITLEAVNISMHRVLREVIRLRQSDTKKSDFVSRALRLVNRNVFNYKHGNLDNLDLIAHVEELLRHCSKHKVSNETVAHCYYTMGLYALNYSYDSNKAVKMLQEAHNRAKDMHDKDEVFFEKTKRQLFKALHRNGDDEEAERLMGDYKGNDVELLCDLAAFFMNRKGYLDYGSSIVDYLSASSRKRKRSTRIYSRLKTEEYWRKADLFLSRAEELQGEKEDSSKARIVHTRGNYYMKTHETDDAINSFRAALELKEQCSAPRIEVARTLNQLAGALYKQYKKNQYPTTFQALLVHAKAALEIRINHYHPHAHGDILASVVLLGKIYRSYEKLEKAIYYFEEAEALRKKGVSTLEKTRYLLSDTLRQAGFIKEASSVLDRANDASLSESEQKLHDTLDSCNQALCPEGCRGTHNYVKKEAFYMGSESLKKLSELESLLSALSEKDLDKIEAAKKKQQEQLKSDAVLAKSLAQILEYDSLEKNTENNWLYDDDIRRILSNEEWNDVDILPAIDATNHAYVLAEIIMEHYIAAIQDESGIKQFVLIPINFNNAHWAALIIQQNYVNPSSPNVYFFDSMGIKEQTQALLLKILTGTDIYINPNLKDISQHVQEDGHTCGTWLIEVSKMILSMLRSDSSDDEVIKNDISLISQEYIQGKHAEYLAKSSEMDIDVNLG